MSQLDRRRVRRVAGALRVVHEEGPVRRERPRRLDPRDSLVGQVGVEVVVRVPGPSDERRPVDQVWVEERLLARDVAVELVEADARRPEIERAAHVHLRTRALRCTCRSSRCSSPSSAGSVPIVEMLCGRKLVSPGNDDAVPATPAMLLWCALRPVSSAARVGEQSGLTWKLMYFKPSGREPVEGRRVDRPAHAGRVGVARLIHQHDDDVGRALRWLDLEARRRRDLPPLRLGRRLIDWTRDRQDLAQLAVALRRQRHELDLFLRRQSRRLRERDQADGYPGGRTEAWRSAHPFPPRLAGAVRKHPSPTLCRTVGTCQGSRRASKSRSLCARSCARSGVKSRQLMPNIEQRLSSA